MKLAIPHWQGRVSPVFDVSGNLLIVEIDDGAEQARRDVVFDTEDLQRRVVRLTETGASVLVCGAISRPLEMAVAAAGIEVVSQICGDLESVLAGFIEGRLNHPAFLMPGCCGRRRRFQGGRRGRQGRHGRKGGDDNAQR